MNSIPSKCIVILGMHRSGTSALTGLLHSFGFHAGNRLLPANESNQRGYFECADIVRVHDELLNALGSQWDGLLPLPEEWQFSSAAQVAKSKLLSVFKAEFGGTDVCVLKDPRMCLLLPLWQDIFTELGVAPVFIIMLRSPSEVVMSLANRNAMNSSRGLLLYQTYLMDAERYTRSEHRLILNFDALLKDRTMILKKIIAAFDISLPYLSKESEAAAGAFLSAELKHFNTTFVSPNEATDKLSQLARCSYKLLTVEQDTVNFSEIDSLYSDFKAYRQTLEPWLSKSERLEYELLRPGTLCEEILSKGTESAIYWRSSEQPKYCEAQKIRTSFNFSNQRQKLCFVFPPQISNLIGLRFDLTNRPAFCTLHSLHLENSSGTMVWKYDMQEPVFFAPSGDMHLLPVISEKSGQEIFSTGFDPYAHLNLPTQLLSQVSAGWALIADVTFQLTHVGLPSVLSGYTQCAKRLDEIRYKQIELEQTLTQALHRESAQADEIVTLNQQHKHFRDEIIRAEAQLGLLKDLMLKDGELEKW